MGKRWHLMTEDEKERSRASSRAAWARKTIEERRLKNRRKSKMTAAEKTAKSQAWHAALTPERAEARRLRKREIERERRRVRGPDPTKTLRGNLRSMYGIELEQFRAMEAAQGGRCSICGTTDPGAGRRRLSVDHDHRTGAVRALLCGPCNSGLGMFHDNPIRLEQAAPSRARAESSVTHGNGRQAGDPNPRRLEDGQDQEAFDRGRVGLRRWRATERHVGQGRGGREVRGRHRGHAREALPQRL